MAVCKAVETSTCPLIVCSDSQYFVQTWHRIKGSTHCPAKHADLWAYLLRHPLRIASAHWIKSHIPSGQEAVKRGFSWDYWEGNRRADILAREGAHGHPTQKVTLLQYAQGLKLVASVQRHMLYTWQWIIDSAVYKKNKAAKVWNRHCDPKRKHPGDHTAKSRAPRTRKQRSCASTHRLQPHGRFWVCGRCGRWRGAGVDHPLKGHKWAKKCSPIPPFRTSEGAGPRFGHACR